MLFSSIFARARLPLQCYAGRETMQERHQMRIDGTYMQIGILLVQACKLYSIFVRPVRY